MKLRRLEIAGFRGVAGKITLDLAPGFVIIVGSNGSGKSTICDAIEFALTGTIRASSGHKEKGESILDYVWWRGPGTHDEAYVELHIENEAGNVCQIRRTRTDLKVAPSATLATLLCTSTDALDDPIAQLVRTMIVRDEEITQLSIDLRETDRFEFVRAVIGSADFGAAETKAKRVADILKGHRDQTQRGYDIARDRVAQLSARLSQAKANASKAAGVADCEDFLRSLLRAPPPDKLALFAAAEKELANVRVRVEQLTGVYSRLQSVTSRLTQIQTEDYVARSSELDSRIRAIEVELDLATEEARAAALQLGAAQQSAPRAASLATLHEQGARLGLQDGCCPLCGAARGEKDFNDHLQVVQAEAERLSKSVTELTQKHAAANARLLSLTSQLTTLKGEQQRHQNAGIALASERSALRVEAHSLGCDIGDAQDVNEDSIIVAIETQRATVNRAQAALAVLAASRAVEEAVDLERQLAIAKDELTKSERRMAHLTEAHSQVREAVSSLRRLQGEIIDERLAELSPLLTELYERLRPHLDWQSVRYRLRGDVRRMLSFEVGDSLNPSFLFSSGQRRAAGLAFILALHLSRRWCKLKTLVLDDPVQHVDDYRALHLAEVLAAIRRQDHQVVCTVEDAALGELLARRLRSSEASNGVVVAMKYNPRRGVSIESEKVVRPFSPRILLSA